MKNEAAQAQRETSEPGAGNEKSKDTGRLARATIIGLMTLAVCLPVQPTLASLDHPVTRPLLIVEGHMTLVVNPATGAYQFTDSGLATLIGLYSNSGSGILDLATGEFVSGSGVVFAANGDTIDWIVGTTPNTIVDISGTGRFEGVTGGFAVNVLSQTLLSNNPDGTLTFAITYSGSGTLTY